jgi:RND family efflux transporter MFP subunit
MLLSGISWGSSGVKSMTVTDHRRRARKFEHIAGQSSYLAPVLEQRRVAAADSIVFSRENRGKVRLALFRAVPLALFLLPATVVFAAGCRSPKAALFISSPEVEVASVIQKDVPIYSEWVATLDGYVNTQIQPQVTGYVIRQTYKEGSFVRKGQILFQIDPRPFQALLDQANAQLAQAQAQLGKTQMDVDRDTPLAKARAIAQSQLDNDVQVNRAAQAAVKAAEAQVDQAKLNLEFTDVKSLIDGISGIAQVQIGNLVNPTTVLTSVSQINPIKAYFSISEQEYIHFADRINTETQRETPSNSPANGHAVLPTIDSGSLSQRVRCPGCVSQDTGIPRAAGTALRVRRGRGTPFTDALHGRRHGLFGSLD